MLPIIQGIDPGTIDSYWAVGMHMVTTTVTHGFIEVGKLVGNGLQPEKCCSQRYGWLSTTTTNPPRSWNGLIQSNSSVQPTIDHVLYTNERNRHAFQQIDTIWIYIQLGVTFCLNSQAVAKATRTIICSTSLQIWTELAHYMFSLVGWHIVWISVWINYLQVIVVPEQFSARGAGEHNFAFRLIRSVYLMAPQTLSIKSSVILHPQGWRTCR